MKRVYSFNIWSFIIRFAVSMCFISWLLLLPLLLLWYSIKSHLYSGANSILNFHFLHPQPNVWCVVFIILYVKGPAAFINCFYWKDAMSEIREEFDIEIKLSLRNSTHSNNRKNRVFSFQTKNMNFLIQYLY